MRTPVSEEIPNVVSAEDKRGITLDDLRVLAEVRAEPVVSIFFSTPRATFARQQYEDRLKTLLSQSRALLAARGLSRDESDALEEPARRLLQDEVFWSRRSHGLALYLTPSGMRHYRVPYAVRDLVAVSDAPCIRPLLQWAGLHGTFCVLAFSRNRVRMLRGNLEELHEVDLAHLGVPQSLSEALRYDDIERHMQSHATGRADVRQQTHSQSTGRAGRHVWGGHEGGDEQTKQQLTRFFQAIDHGVCTLLAHERTPIVLAGVDYERDLYRSLSKYPRLINDGIGNNPDQLSNDDLLALVGPIAKRYLQTPSLEAVDRYREASTVGDASDELGEVVRAAHEGRVSTLLLDPDAEVWGSYDPIEHMTWVTIRRRSTDTDLIDLALRETLLHGGTPFAIRSDRMPTGSHIAATYRF